VGAVDDARRAAGFRLALDLDDGEGAVVGIRVAGDLHVFVGVGAGVVGDELIDQRRAGGAKHPVGAAGRVVRLPGGQRAGEAGQPRAVKVVEHPVGDGVGVRAVGDARRAAGGERRSAKAGRQHRRVVRPVANAAIADGHTVDDARPGRDIEHTVVAGVQILPESAAEAFHQQQRDRAVLKRVGQKPNRPEAGSAGQAQRKDAVNHAGAGAVALDLEQRQGAVVGIRGAEDLHELVGIRAIMVGDKLIDHRVAAGGAGRRPAHRGQGKERRDQYSSQEKRFSSK